MIPEKTWLYFIVDIMNRSLFRLNGLTQRSSLPVPLPQHPKGWDEISISFGTAFKYWNLNESFVLPMFFVGDGADILRDIIYGGKGYEEEYYIVILKLNTDTGIYELEYKARLDFVKKRNIPLHGIHVNAVQGGLLSYLAANEGVEYELEMNETNPAAFETTYDGMRFYDNYKYSVIPLTFHQNQKLQGFTLPFPFIINEGDSVGIIQGSQEYENISSANANMDSDIDSYCAASANYIFESVNAITISLVGKILVKCNAVQLGNLSLKVYYNTSLGNKYVLYDAGLHPNDSLSIDATKTITLAAGEKLFLVAKYAFTGAAVVGSFEFLASDVNILFNSINPPSTAYTLSALDALKQLVLKMTEGRYTADSVFLATCNIHVTSTDALRKFPGAKYKISFQDFFNDFNCLKNLGMKVVNNVLWLEPKPNLYKDDTDILDLGEVANLEIRYADDLLVNLGTFGYKSQDYRQASGKYEFNTTTQFKFPVNSLKNEYKMILKSRGDAFGIEYARAMAFNKPTTDSTNDNEPFVVNIRKVLNTGKDFTAEKNVPEIYSGTPKNLTFDVYTGVIFAYAATNDILYYTDAPHKANIKFDIDSNTLSGVCRVEIIKTGVTISDTTGAQVRTINLYNVILGLADTLKVVITAADNITVNSSKLYIVEPDFFTGTIYRKNYVTLTGVLDNTVFNIEEMTPHRLLLAHGSTLRSLMVQMQADLVTFLNADKNADLVTDGFAEKQSEAIGNFDAPFFFPFYFKFTTAVPDTFAKIFSKLGTGYISFKFAGVQMYALPIGKMDAKPATNPAQSWEILASAKNSLEILKLLPLQGIFTIDSMGNTFFTSDLNVLHFNKYNYVLPAKYKHKEIYDDEFSQRQDEFISNPNYVQLVENNDQFIPIQVITRGLDITNVLLYNSDAKLVRNEPMNIINQPGVLAPYVLSNYNLDVTGLTGIHFVVLASGETPVRISEYFNVQQVHYGSKLIEYSNTKNKDNVYFSDTFVPKLRLNLKLLPWFPDSTFEDFTDEIHDVELLDGRPFAKRNLKIPPIPDWMALKINRILLLNRTFIEGVQYSRSPDSKFNKKDFPGSPMSTYLIEILRAENHNGLATDETGSEDGGTIIYTLDAQAFGIEDAGATINIELKNE